MKFLLGQKLGMSQVFDEKGKRIPVTLVEAGPCVVTQIKTKEKDGYQAIQLGFKKIEKEKKIKKPMRKYPFRWLREFKGEESKLSSSPVASAPEGEEDKSFSFPTELLRSKSEGKKENEVLFAFATAREDGEYKVGDQIDVSVFQEGKKVKVSGISKGKGFQGAVKRWGFKGRASATHGTKHEHRTLGSIGSSFPEKVIKGKKMPGRMGSERTTVKNLEIVKIDKENNLLAVKGAVPGVNGTLLEIRG